MRPFPKKSFRLLVSGRDRRDLVSSGRGYTLAILHPTWPYRFRGHEGPALAGRKEPQPSFCAIRLRVATWREGSFWLGGESDHLFLTTRPT